MGDSGVMCNDTGRVTTLSADLARSDTPTFGSSRTARRPGTFSGSPQCDDMVGDCWAERDAQVDIRIRVRFDDETFVCLGHRATVRTNPNQKLYAENIQNNP